MRVYRALALFTILAGASIMVVGGTGAFTPSGNPNVVQASTGPIHLYVDAVLGSDSNACTDAGTYACSTITGALAKLPTNINDTVTVTVAGNDAGTQQQYVENPLLTGFTARTTDAGYSTTVGPLISFVGPTGWVDVPVCDGGSFLCIDGGTGTASGNLTAYSDVSGTTAATLTDSNQTWVNSSLKSAFVVIMDGGTPGTKMPIIDNTATTLRLSGNLGSPGVGAAYRIQMPAVAVVATGSAGAQAPFTMDNMSAPVALSDFEIRTGAAGTPKWPAYTDVRAAVSMTRLRFAGNDGLRGLSTFPLTNVSAPFTLTSCYIHGQGTVMTLNSVNSLTLNTTAIRGSSSVLYFQRGYNSVHSNGLTVEQSTTTGSGAISFPFDQNGEGGNNSLTVSSTPLRIICPSGADTAYGIYALGNTANVRNWGVEQIRAGSFVIEDCNTGMALAGSETNFDVTAGGAGSSLITNATNGITLINGSHLALLNGHTLTLTTVTNELTIDGVVRAFSTLGANTITYPGTGTSAIGGATAGPLIYGVNFIWNKPTLPTCSATLEGSMVRQKGGSSEGYTKLCVCASDGAASPTYLWCSWQLAAGASTLTCTGGNTTTCP
jgi:hypothetical protein